MCAKILVLDDEPNVLRLISYTLQHEGHEIIGAKSGMEALTKAKEEHPDLFILDVMLPDMSGLDVCRALRDTDYAVATPVIMLSAKGQTNDKISGLESGADEYLTKPFMPEELVARVKAILSRYAVLRQAKAKKHGMVVGCIGAKGGVGTTTVVLNVAKALLDVNKKVVAAEMRSTYGTFSAQLNLDAAHNISSLLEYAPKKIDEREVEMRLINRTSGLRILASPQKVEDYREIEPEQAEAIIDTLSTLADYVVLDLPCSPSAANQAAIKRCDRIAVVIEPEPSCLASAAILLKLLASWGIMGQAIGVVVVNRVPLSLPIKIGDIEKTLGQEIFGVIPPSADALMAAQRVGMPVVTYHHEGFTASSLIETAKKLTNLK